MNKTVGLSPKFELKEVWVTIENPALSMSNAVRLLRARGNQIVNIDIRRRRIQLYKDRS